MESSVGDWSWWWSRIPAGSRMGKRGEELASDAPGVLMLGSGRIIGRD